MAALPALDAAETAATLKKVSHDLSFLFADRGMAPGLQLLFARTGFLTMNLFTAVSDSRAELRLLLAEDYGLDPAEGAITPLERITRRTQAAAVIDCWEAARRRVDEKDKLAASQVASRVPTTLPKSEHLALRKRYENDFGAVPDKGYPCPTLIEKRFQELEEGEVTADTLTEVISREDTVEDPLGAFFDTAGIVRVKRQGQKGSMPSGSEELRARIRMLGITFQLALLKHPNKPWLSTASPNMWLGHLDYILGEDVFLMKFNGVQPPWTLILAYELQIRKLAIKYIQFEDKDLATAMKDAAKNVECRERHFVSAFTCHIATACAAPAAVPTPGFVTPPRKTPANAWKSKKFKKGKGGKGGGKTREMPKHEFRGGKGQTKTPDGRQICFTYNNGKTCDGSCGMVHCCQYCMGGHPKSTCPTPRAAAQPGKGGKHGAAPAFAQAAGEAPDQ
jgi:hypothetical protein